MKQEGSILTGDMDAPSKLMPELVIMSLAENGRPTGLHNNRSNEITVSQEKQKSSGHEL